MLGLKVFKRGATFSDTSWKPRTRVSKTGSFRLFTRADHDTRDVRRISFCFIYKFNCLFGHSHIKRN